MQLSKKNNTIIIKEVESNIFDEAIIVLKPGIKIKQGEISSKRNILCDNTNENNVVIMEAQEIINEYISKIQKKQNQKKEFKLRKKYLLSKILNFVLFTCIILILKKFM